MFTLCNVCNKANSDAFPEGDCHICGGWLSKLERMLEEGKELLKKEDASGFSIATLVPKDWLIQEEGLWDEKVNGARSIKDYLNRTVSAELEKESGLSYSAESDCRVVFDMRSGKVSIKRNTLFIFGRYYKHEGGVSQSRWPCKSCQGGGCGKCNGKGKLHESIEEIIGNPAKKECGAGSYSLHASGREDVDALNSAGRPFVLSLENPENRKPDLDIMAKNIAQDGRVSVADLKIVGRSTVECVTESHFDKGYEAEAEFGRELAGADIEKALSLSGEMLRQRTPTRVKHRRADIVRERRVLSLEVLEWEGKTAKLRIMAEAGTYIKELISGDEGRTEPSIAAMLGTDAKCTKLTVSEIDDGFLGMFHLERKT